MEQVWDRIGPIITQCCKQVRTSVPQCSDGTAKLSYCRGAVDMGTRTPALPSQEIEQLVKSTADEAAHHSIHLSYWDVLKHDPELAEQLLQVGPRTRSVTGWVMPKMQR